MKTLVRVIQWVFLALFLLFSIESFSNTDISGGIFGLLLVIAIAPGLWKKLHEKFNAISAYAIRVGITFVLIVLTVSIFPPTQEEIEQSKVKEEVTEPTKIQDTLKKESALDSHSITQSHEGIAKKLAKEMKKKSPVIPGLMPVDVYGSLKSMGFEIKKDFNPCCIWMASDGSQPVWYKADIYGEDAASVKRINAWIVGFDGIDYSKLGKPYLGFIASLPYDGSQPDKARSWVEKNINRKGAETDIGGVRFKIDLTKTSRHLSVFVAK